MMRKHIGLWVFLAVVIAACGPQLGPQGSLVSGEDPEIKETSSLALLFEEASVRHDVPSDVLKALAYVETGFEPATGEVEFEGQPAPYGIFNMRGQQIETAATLTGYTQAQIQEDKRANIEAAAAILSAAAIEHGMASEARSGPELWRPVLETWANLADEEMRIAFAQDVLEVIANGLAVPMHDGSTLLINRHTMNGEFVEHSQGLRARGTVWRPSPNNSSRNGVPVEAVIIHTCEGSYSGCVSWLRQSRSRVSAHYVVKENGTEISQLVDESRKAWHIGARYRSSLNNGRLSSRNGQSSNNFTIGIEHGGSAGQRSFPEGQIDASVELVRGIVARHNIPPDRYHIIAHAQLQPESRNDPGPNWPWASYLRRIAQGTTSPSPSNPPTPPPSNPPTPPSSNPPAPPAANPPSVITVDNTDASRFSASSNWERSSYASGRVGSDYRYQTRAFRSDTAKYKIAIPQTGRYEVFARIPGNGYNASIPYIIRHQNGQTVVNKDVSNKGGQWLSLGAYSFARKDDWIFDVSVWTGTGGIIIADAVRFVRR